jgi:RNA polymerase sigma-70 factor (ECF subfamily)
LLRRIRLRQQIQTLRPRLFRLAWSWCHDGDLADDLTQAALEKALRSLDSLREHQRVDAWLSAILANLYRDHLRSARRVESIEPDELYAPGKAPETWLEEHQIVLQVRKAVARLNPDQRLVLTLVDLMGLSYAEVAEALSIPAGTVMSRLSRARVNLKRFLGTTTKGGNTNKVVPIRRLP